MPAKQPWKERFTIKSWESKEQWCYIPDFSKCQHVPTTSVEALSPWVGALFSLPGLFHLCLLCWAFCLFFIHNQKLLKDLNGTRELKGRRPHHKLLYVSVSWFGYKWTIFPDCSSQSTDSHSALSFFSISHNLQERCIRARLLTVHVVHSS